MSRGARVLVVLVFSQSLLTSAPATNSFQSGTVSFTAASGVSFTNARVVRVEPDGITVIDGTRGGKFHFTALPEEVRTRFRYEATAATLYRAEKEFNTRTSIANERRNRAAAQAHRERTNRIAQSVMYIHGPVIGREAKGLVVRSGERLLEIERGIRRKLNVWEGSPKEVTVTWGDDVFVFVGLCVLMDHGEVKIGEVVSATAYPNGRVKGWPQFTTRAGAVREIADPETLAEMRAPWPLYGSRERVCTGAQDCQVCRTCSGCGYCKEGRRCGVCASKKK